jgi:hypothetical protein
MRYADAVAQEILTTPAFTSLREQMVALLTQEQCKSMEIAQRLNGSMQLKEGVKITTAASIVRRVLRAIVDPEVLAKVHAKHHADTLDRHRHHISRKRDDWMRFQGMHIWTDAENQYFDALIKNPSMKRTKHRMSRKKGRMSRKKKHLNHELIAVKMNERFGLTVFTSALTRQHLDYLHQQQKKARARLREKKETLELSADERSKLHDAVRVAPLVIVPAEDLREIATNGARKGGIDNAAATVTDEVMGDERALFDPKNALE